MNQSLDFINLPALMQSLEDPDYLAHLHPETAFCRPKFEYDSRAINHYSVNKMTYESQAYATINRGSFAEIEKNRQDFTGDSELIAPVMPSKQNIFDRLLSASGVQPATPLTPNKGFLEAPQLAKGLLDTPCENSELYDDFDIFHEMIEDASD